MTIFDKKSDVNENTHKIVEIESIGDQLGSKYFNNENYKEIKNVPRAPQNSNITNKNNKNEKLKTENGILIILYFYFTKYKFFY